MIGKKLIKLLTALDPTEFRRMRKLFQSPIYTSNPHHLKLYDHLKKYYPRFKSRQLEKEIVFEKIYQGQPFDDWKLRGLVTEFTRLTEEYFIMVDNRKNDFQRKRQLTKIYGERNLYDFFEKGTKNLLADLEASPFRDMHYYWHRAQLNEAWYFHPMKNKYDLKDDCLDDLMESLDKYFVLGKMRFGIAMKNVERILAKRYALRFLEAIGEEKALLEGEGLFQLYELTFDLISLGEEEIFEQLEKLLFEQMEMLSLEDKQLIFYAGLNFISGQINKGVSKFSKKAFEWNRVGLLHDLFIENERMNENIFGNIVIAGCRVKEFQWVKEFIESHQNFVEFKKRNDVVIFNWGIWNYYQGNFQETYSLLSDYSFSTAYLLRSRLIIIESLFELFLENEDNFDILIYQIQAFEIFILRNKNFSKAKLAPHLNFIRIVKKVASKIQKRDSKSSIKKVLEKRLQSSKNISGKKWLADKLKQFEK